MVALLLLPTVFQNTNDFNILESEEKYLPMIGTQIK